MSLLKNLFALVVSLSLIFGIVSSFGLSNRRSANVGGRQRLPTASALLLSNGKSNNLYEKQQAALLAEAEAAASANLNGLRGLAYGLNKHGNMQQMVRGLQQQHQPANNFNQMGAFGMTNFNNPMMSQMALHKKMLRDGESKAQASGGRKRGETASSTPQRQRKTNKSPESVVESPRGGKLKKEQKLAKTTTSETVVLTTSHIPIATTLPNLITTPKQPETQHTTSTFTVRKQIKEPRKRTTTSAP
jgi:hypothetical protein